MLTLKGVCSQGVCPPVLIKNYPLLIKYNTQNYIIINMDLSEISYIGWIVIGCVAIAILLLMYKLVIKGKKIKTPLFRIESEDDGKSLAFNSKNTVQGSSVYGNVGDNIFIGTASQVSPLQKQLYTLCIKTLSFAKENRNMVSAEDLKKLCGKYSDDVYQIIYDEKVFHPIAGQRKMGIGKMKTQDISRLITKYKIELSRQ